MKPVTIIILAAVAVMNLISFFLMAHDKRCAQQGSRRVPEKTLFLVTGLFGGLDLPPQDEALVFRGVFPGDADGAGGDCRVCAVPRGITEVNLFSAGTFMIRSRLTGCDREGHGKEG